MCYKENTRLVEACPSNFWRSEKKKKKKKKDKGKRERVSKQVLLKVCH